MRKQKIMENETKPQTSVETPTLDCLELIFEMQENLDNLIEAKNNQMNLHERPIFGEEKLIAKCVALQQEVCEVMNELPFKYWSKKNQERQIDIEKLKFELIDVMHFVVSMCLTAGIDYIAFYEAYLRKNTENIRRAGNGY